MNSAHDAKVAPNRLNYWLKGTGPWQNGAEWAEWADSWNAWAETIEMRYTVRVLSISSCG